jgi:hypothetical protein
MSMAGQGRAKNTNAAGLQADRENRPLPTQADKPVDWAPLAGSGYDTEHSHKDGKQAPDVTKIQRSKANGG